MKDFSQRLGGFLGVAGAAGEAGEEVARPADGSRRTLTYQPALDGLRGLAVAAVLLYHGDVSWAKGGFLGVDAFFVLSGYLITSLLLVEWRAAGRLNLPAFWARRARRLLPALFLMLGGVVVYRRVACIAGTRGVPRRGR